MGKLGVNRRDIYPICTGEEDRVSQPHSRFILFSNFRGTFDIPPGINRGTNSDVELTFVETLSLNRGAPDTGVTENKVKQVLPFHHYGPHTLT